MKKLLFLNFTFICSLAFSQIIMTVTHTNVSCFGLCDGSASVTVSGGASPYIYWATNGSVTPNITNLCAGQYTVHVLDADSNEDSISINITQPSLLNSQVNTNNVKCFGTATGTMNVIGIGGTIPYTYLWAGLGYTLSTVSNVPIGNYGVTITDANGCQVTQSVNIVQPSQITAAASITNSSCGGACDGAVSMLVTGGAPGYIFTWTPAMLGNASSLSNLCSGIYTFQVTDGNNCSVTNVISILSAGNNTIPNTTVTSVAYNETCLQSGDGSIDITISGTNPGPFTYQWNNGSTTEDLNNIYSNTYWVTISDGNSNCLTIIDSITSIGTNCGSIQGHVFIDNNGDCLQNAGDNNFTNASIIVNPGNRYGSANYNGDYIINNLPYGTYSVSLNLNSTGSILSTCVTTINTNVSSGNPNSLNNNLTAGFNSVSDPDLNIFAYNLGIVPGFVCRMNYILRNLNNVNGAGLIKVTLPSSFISNIITASSGYTISGDTVIWNFSNVMYSNGAQYYFVDFTVPSNTPLGSTFLSCMYAQPNITDFDYTNNNTCYSRLVAGSFDPNDKTVSPVGLGSNGNITATETDLTYLIRFQNTGNGPAVNIVVKDTLSLNVDVSTFEMLSASHNYNIEIMNGNILKWKFNNIMLPDSNSNEPASHGYIQYRIKRNNNNTPGTQIKNTAYIYFDFNEPVVTNTTINTIETVTGIKVQAVNDNEWNMYPNPNKGTLFLVNSTLLKERSQVTVLNAVGQIVHEETINSNTKILDLADLNSGIYFVKITSDKQSSIKRIVLSK